ncbi:putative DNA-binding transcriptional regulator [Mycoplana sp. BE70]|uniref:hypothetical protein n=1 Tax=Mycoplana sp. BE70 TaxID=2817775 RepID=UPI002864C512|nr:hypothetical protein [Mycoplana sp. BE70]MDR6757807.1 putative DNA-binding transcriptional regulator [Mycoplana sp. BE70]
MPVVTITTEVSFDVAVIQDDVIKSEFNRRADVKKWAHDYWQSQQPPEKTIEDFDDEELLDELENRDIDLPQMETIHRVYRLLASRDIEAAMDELHREFGLAPPSHECAIADLLSGTSRSPAHV